MASLLRQALDKIPPRVRNRLKNPLTLWMHRWLVMRPRLTSGHPTGFLIELTDICNLSCSYCPKSIGVGVKGNHIDFNLFRKVVDEAVASGPMRLAVLVGFGEPFLYPHLEEAVAYVKSKSSHIKVTMTSNGTLLSADWGRRLAEIGLDQITISVNATNRERYFQINRKDCYDQVVSNTRAFLEAVNSTTSKMRVLVQVLELPDGSTDIPAFRRFWEPYLGRCGEIQIQPFVNWAGLIREEDVVPLQPTRRKEISNVSPVGKYNGADPPGRHPCAHLLNSFMVTREGNALACCMVLANEAKDLELGNVQDKSLVELYFGERARELRRLNVEGRLSEIETCRQCDAYRTSPNVWLLNPFHRWFGPRWL